MCSIRLSTVLLLLGCYPTDTTDVQIVEVIYFRDNLFLRCSFADNSRARGCAVRLSLADRNNTEIYRFLRESDDLPCFETDYRLDEYSEVVILDIEEDEMLGSGYLTIAIDPMDEETTEEMYIDITGCLMGKIIGLMQGFPTH